MNLVPVTSSNIAKVGYDPVASKLRVEFTNGAQYDYSSVNEDTFIGLRDASSVGKFFHANIKGKFDFIKLN
jgi:hypothetical protein